MMLEKCPDGKITTLTDFHICTLSSTVICWYDFYYVMHENLSIADALNILRILPQDLVNTLHIRVRP